MNSNFPMNAADLGTMQNLPRPYGKYLTIPFRVSIGKQRQFLQDDPLRYAFIIGVSPASAVPWLSLLNGPDAEGDILGDEFALPVITSPFSPFIAPTNPITILAPAGDVFGVILVATDSPA
jgi:hypothetical protein